MRWPLQLDLAGIYFVAGWLHAQETRRLYRKLDRQLRKHDRVHAEARRILDAKPHERASASERRAYDAAKADVDVALIWDLRRLEIVFEPVIRAAALSYVLVVAAAEAFINAVADHVLKGRTFEEFDSLSLIGKWYFLPQIMKLKGFSFDKGPLQLFSDVVRVRNKLMHHRPRKMPLPTFDPHEFLSEMKLTPDGADRSVEAVRTLIETFSSAWVGSDGSDWLRPADGVFRRPCFYFGAPCAGAVFYADDIDKERDRAIGAPEDKRRKRRLRTDLEQRAHWLMVHGDRKPKRVLHESAERRR